MNKKILAIMACLVVFQMPIAQAKMSKEAVQLYSQALNFESQKRYEDAVDLIIKALATSEEDVILNTKAAGLYGEIGNFDKALEYYQKALKLRPDDAFLYISIGNILQLKLDYENAINAYEQAMAIAPNYQYNRINLGNILFIRSIAS